MWLCYFTGTKQFLTLMHDQFYITFHCRVGTLAHIFASTDLKSFFGPTKDNSQQESIENSAIEIVKEMQRLRDANSKVTAQETLVSHGGQFHLRDLGGLVENGSTKTMYSDLDSAFKRRLLELKDDESTPLSITSDDEMFSGNAMGNYL